MADFLNGETLAALLTLTSLEMVLGIDNIVFIAILCGKLPEAQRDRARTLGLLLAVVSRIMLVMAIGWVMTLTRDLFTILGEPISGKDLILIFGGLFLVFKGTREIHHKMQDARNDDTRPITVSSLQAVLLQVLIIDVVFSLDSVITAVGMTEGLKHAIPVMVTAILLSVMGMLLFSKAIVVFIERNPTIKILALSFLLLIGVLLIAEGFGHHIPKGYVYFAMSFSFIVDMLQLWTLKPPKPRITDTQY
jgi:predicted tellurium resistance membrane protein TerC